jgi:diaminopimelate decarboxylase
METPYFIIHEQKLTNNIEHLKEALSTEFPHFDISYSFKTNSLPWIIEQMKVQGIGAEVVSDDEYQLALALGYRPEQITFNGPIKSKQQFLHALVEGARVNIETKREVSWLLEAAQDKSKRFSVGIRVHVDLLNTVQEEATHIEGGRFGFFQEELDEVVATLKKEGNIQIAGLHLHTSSKKRSKAVYQQIAETAVEVDRRYHLALEYIDVGGGFFYSGESDDHSFESYFSTIHQVLKQQFNLENLVIVVEPGAALIASPVSFVTSVIEVKSHRETHFVVTDGSRINIDPLMQKSQYDFTIKRQNGFLQPKLKRQIISGFTCMESDRIFNLDHSLPLRQMDQITYHKVGSYTMTLAPLFISYFPEVYVQSAEGNLTMVRKKWTVTDYLKGGSIQ